MQFSVLSSFHCGVALAACVLVAGPVFAQNAIDANPSSIRDLGFSSGGNGPSQNASPDVEAQLREMENTKKLMKALGELHAKSTPGNPGTSPGPAGIVPPATTAASPQQLGGAEREGASLGIAGVPLTGVREAAGTAAQVARSLSGDTRVPSPGSLPERGDSSATPFGSALEDGASGARGRPRGADDEYRTQTLISAFLEEIQPWAIGFGLILALFYAIFSWVTARASRATGQKSVKASSSHGSRRRRSSR